MEGASEHQAVKVCLRIRPLHRQEVAQGSKEGIRIVSSDTVETTHLVEGGRKVDCYRHTFDSVLPQESSQDDVFQKADVAGLCASAVQGFHTTVLAYGQTGSGKTHTMLGPPDGSMTGLIPKAASQIFSYLRAMAREADAQGVERPDVRVQASFLEIYNEHVYDLLSGNDVGLPVRWSASSQSFFAENAMVVACDGYDDLMAVVEEGVSNRSTSAHLLNADSSRSHSILTVYFDASTTVPASGPGGLASRQTTYGKMNFVDLAGSERVKDTGSAGGALVETCHINKSLLALAQVVTVLSDQASPQNVDGVAHVPYRDSKLTMLLMDSLGGGCKTLMIACITPASLAQDETRNTLFYATRARSISNAPVVRMGSKQSAVHEMRLELERLRKENLALKALSTQTPGLPPSSLPSFSSDAAAPLDGLPLPTGGGASPAARHYNGTASTSLASSSADVQQPHAAHVHQGSASVSLRSARSEARGVTADTAGTAAAAATTSASEAEVAGVEAYSPVVDAADDASGAPPTPTPSSSAEAADGGGSSTPLQAALDTVARLQMENERLKTENVGLKKQMRRASYAGGPPLAAAAAAAAGAAAEAKPGVLVLAGKGGKGRVLGGGGGGGSAQPTGGAASAHVDAEELMDAGEAEDAGRQESLACMVRLLKTTLARVSVEADALRQDGVRAAADATSGVAAVVQENVRLVEVLHGFDLLRGASGAAAGAGMAVPAVAPRTPPPAAAALEAAQQRVCALEEEAARLRAELEAVTVAPAPEGRQHIVERREHRLQTETCVALRVEVARLRSALAATRRRRSSAEEAVAASRTSSAVAASSDAGKSRLSDTSASVAADLPHLPRTASAASRASSNGGTVGRVSSAGITDEE